MAPKLRVLPSDRFDEIVAEDLLGRMRDSIGTKRKVVVALPFGDTPKGVYALWISEQHNLDWSKVVFVNGDEYLGLGHAHRHSAGYSLRHHLLDPLVARQTTPAGPVAANIRLFNGLAEPREEARAHERFIARHGGIDIAMLGIGAGPRWAAYRLYRWLGRRPFTRGLVGRLASSRSSVHLWFNERRSPFDSRTRVVNLADQTRRINGVPYEQALTLGLGNLAEARQIVLLAKGKNKRSAIDLLLDGPLTDRIPATVLRHPSVIGDVTVFVDTEAAP